MYGQGRDGPGQKGPRAIAAKRTVSELNILCNLMLGSHCRFSSIASEVRQKNEECRHVPTKTLCANKVDDPLVDEVEHVLLLADFCR